MLDEADALLSDRAHARHSWELSQAAEFLHGIQEFPGVLIACTNRVEQIDSALRRRFHRHAYFGALRADLVPAALGRFLPQFIWAAEEATLQRLSGGPELMMSDIANAADVLEFADEGELSPDRIVLEILSNATTRDMSRSIGF